MFVHLRRCAIFLLSALAFCVCAAEAVAAGAPESRYFRSSDGVRLRYLEIGQGPTLVFVPGWTMPADIWEPQWQYFASAFRVIAVDPRGQGGSDIARGGYTAKRRARDIAELLARLDEPVVLIGWSLAVQETLEYVNQAGTARVRALVLVDGSVGEEPPPKGDPTFLKRLRRNRGATIEVFVREMFRTPQSEVYLRRLIAASLRVPLEASIALLRYPYPREHWKDIVYRVDRPILYAVSEYYRGQAENVKRNRPDIWVHVFENAGHALFVDEAASFNSVLEEFLLREVPPATLVNGRDGKNKNR